MSLIVVMNVYCSVVAWLILAGGWPTTYAGDLATSVFMRNPFIGYLVLRAPKIKKLLLLQSFLKGPPWLIFKHEHEFCATGTVMRRRLCNFENLYMLGHSH